VIHCATVRSEVPLIATETARAFKAASLVAEVSPEGIDFGARPGLRPVGRWFGAAFADLSRAGGAGEVGRPAAARSPGRARPNSPTGPARPWATRSSTSTATLGSSRPIRPAYYFAATRDPRPATSRPMGTTRRRSAHPRWPRPARMAPAESPTFKAAAGRRRNPRKASDIRGEVPRSLLVRCFSFRLEFSAHGVDIHQPGAARPLLAPPNEHLTRKAAGSRHSWLQHRPFTPRGICRMSY
jgi:hypothetical protein